MRAVMGGFTLAVVASLRAKQLIRGCIPRVAVEQHKSTTIARLEVEQGQISGTNDNPVLHPTALHPTL